MHTRVQRLKGSMLGPAKSPEMVTFGAQTNGLLMFASDLLVTKGHKLGPSSRLFLRGQEDLVVVLIMIREHRRTMSAFQIQRFCDSAVDHVSVCKSLGMDMRPKHHQMLEMGARL